MVQPFGRARYTNFQQIGEGSQATVFVANDRLSTSPVAIKVYKNFKTVPHEAEILKKIQSKKMRHSVHLKDSFIKGKNYYIVMPMIKGTELFKMVYDISLSEAKNLMKLIFAAVAELHENNICHLDIKMENIIYNQNKNSVKLIDFGFAKRCKRFGKSVKMTNYCGSFPYTSPEIRKHTPYDGKKADVWALGVLLYTMLEREFPFSSEDSSQSAIKFRATVDKATQQFIKSLLNPDPSGRPKITELVNHSWLTSVGKELNTSFTAEQDSPSGALFSWVV